MSEIGLEGEQLDAFNACVDFLSKKGTSDGEFLRFSASAGCGKTYVLRKVVEHLSLKGLRVAVVAFTGRAASQLSDEGVEATTCHALLYKPRLDKDGNLIGWELKDHQEVMEKCRDGIIVDEGSMIPSKIHNELSCLGVKIIYTGDAEQLPPVDPDNASFNLMDSDAFTMSEIRLTKNRRFDESSGIGYIASHLRKNNSIPRISKEGLQFFRKSAVKRVSFHEENQFDVVLCGTNKTRRELNSIIRTARGFEGVVPSVGERIVCLRNGVVGSGEQRINNGELFYIQAVFQGEVYSKFVLEGEKGMVCTVNILNETWNTEKAPMLFDGKSMYCFGYGYCLSVHKSQGSTFGSVLYYDEDVSFFLDQKRFRYTGCTRAADLLGIAI